MKTVVITGANRGIGLALVNFYLAAGDKVFALCRTNSPALERSQAIVITGFDANKPNSFDACIAALKGVNIDILINNAGILRDEQLGSLDINTMQQQFTVNAVAPVVLVDRLKSQLSAGGKVALITSRMGSIEDNTSGGRYGYRMSKAALNAAGMSLSHDLRAVSVSVAILHPGYVKTDMVGGNGLISTTEAASGLAQRIEDLSAETSGTFWHSNGDILPW